MAIKEIRREWSPCQVGYVKHFLLHSEADVKDLPKCCIGSKATVSETDNEYICMADGWKNAAEYDENGKKKATVILLETELVKDGSTFCLLTPPNAQPEVGKTYTVTYNGTTEDMTAISDSGNVCLGDAAETFGIIFLSDELAAEMGCYVAVEVYESAPDTLTLSIVEAVEESGSAGGGRLVVKADCDLTTTTTGQKLITPDKTEDKIRAAIAAGNDVVFEVALVDEEITGTVFLNLIFHNAEIVMFSSAGMYAVQIVAGTGVIFAKMT